MENKIDWLTCKWYCDERENHRQNDQAEARTRMNYSYPDILLALELCRCRYEVESGWTSHRANLAIGFSEKKRKKYPFLSSSRDVACMIASTFDVLAELNSMVSRDSLRSRRWSFQLFNERRAWQEKQMSSIDRLTHDGDGESTRSSKRVDFVRSCTVEERISAPCCLSKLTAVLFP